MFDGNVSAYNTAMGEGLPVRSCRSSADEHVDSLNDIRRELHAIKTERKRRQKAEVRLSHHTPPVVGLPIEVENSQRSQADGSISSWENVSISGSEQVLPLDLGRPCRPTKPFPPELLRMAYASHPDGSVGLDPQHKIGSFVAEVDLSPWRIAKEQTKMLAENRQISTLPNTLAYRTC